MGVCPEVSRLITWSVGSGDGRSVAERLKRGRSELQNNNSCSCPWAKCWTGSQFYYQWLQEERKEADSVWPTTWGSEMLDTKVMTIIYCDSHTGMLVFSEMSPVAQRLLLIQKSSSKKGTQASHFAECFKFPFFFFLSRTFYPVITAVKHEHKCLTLMRA